MQTFSNSSEAYADLRRTVIDRLGIEDEKTDGRVRAEIAKVIAEEHAKKPMALAERVALGKQLFASLRGMDVLQPLLDNERITDIMVNGRDRIYVEEDGTVRETGLRFESRERLEDVIQQIVGKVNRHVNEFSPIADARLPDGSRVNVILPPIALNGPILTIRKFRKEPITIDDMLRWETLTPESADFCRALVQNRYNIFVCGGTGAGKTTLLNVLSNFIPSKERIITIEDAAELRLASLGNVVTLETRASTQEGGGQVTMRDLIRTSLRARPDRIIVGEVRGAEALDMLSAMNTGHDGSLSTGHANSCEDMVSRLETMVLMGAEVPIEAIRSQIASAIDIFIYIARTPDGKRRVTEIKEVVGMGNNQVKMEPIFCMVNDQLQRCRLGLSRIKGHMGWDDFWSI